MKTLDEVIKAYEICMTDNDDDSCKGCPYSDKSGEAFCYGKDREDALYHLKEYKKLLEKPLNERLINVLNEVRK